MGCSLVLFESATLCCMRQSQVVGDGIHGAVAGPGRHRQRGDFKERVAGNKVHRGKAFGVGEGLTALDVTFREQRGRENKDVSPTSLPFYILVLGSVSRCCRNGGLTELQ